MAINGYPFKLGIPISIIDHNSVHNFFTLCTIIEHDGIYYIKICANNIDYDSGVENSPQRKVIGNFYSVITTRCTVCYIPNQSDASIKQVIITFYNSNIQFTYGIPIAGVHIESANNETEYSDFVEIWYAEDINSYFMSIRGSDYNNNKLIAQSEINRAIIFYI